MLQVNPGTILRSSSIAARRQVVLGYGEERLLLKTDWLSSPKGGA